MHRYLQAALQPLQGPRFKFCLGSIGDDRATSGQTEVLVVFEFDSAWLSRCRGGAEGSVGPGAITYVIRALWHCIQFVPKAAGRRERMKLCRSSENMGALHPCN
jgi:hypothetical protein